MGPPPLHQMNVDSVKRLSSDNDLPKRLLRKIWQYFTTTAERCPEGQVSEYRGYGINLYNKTIEYFIEEDRGE